MPLPQHVLPVAPEKAYRLFNLGATVLVSAEHEGDADVMAAAWNSALDLVPCKATVVIDSTHYTRALIEKSGYFALQIPCVGNAKLALAVGSVSKNDDAEKLSSLNVPLFKVDGIEVPLVDGCVAWAVFKVLPEPHNEMSYDLFAGECLGAWADSRVFADGHWTFEKADPALRTLHYVAGGRFYAIGEALDV